MYFLFSVPINSLHNKTQISFNIESNSNSLVNLNTISCNKNGCERNYIVHQNYKQSLEKIAVVLKLEKTKYQRNVSVLKVPIRK